MSRPRIGVCAARERARWGAWDQPADLVPHDYVRALQMADAIALVVPLDDRFVDAPADLLDALDGLVLAGGVDVDPELYGAPRDPATVDTEIARDRAELGLLRGALERDLPVLGICRGMQLLNVACGGTLHQHLPDLLGDDRHCRTRGSFDGSAHRVRLAEGSLAARLAGETEHVVLSHHHQGVARLGDGLRVSGSSLGDGLPEALELDGRRCVVGVQWHPEADVASGVVGRFVDEVRTR